jgi:exopolysaccharide biosynthesis polyprenyl glycosylphosphotransferase
MAGTPHVEAPVTGGEDAIPATPVIQPLPLSPRATVLQQVLDGEGWGALRPTLDALALVAAVLLTVNWPGEAIPTANAWPLALFPLPVMVMLWIRGLYGRRLRASVLEGIAPVAGAISIATMMLVALEVYVAGNRLQIGALTHVWALSIITLGGGRVALICLQNVARTRGWIGRPALIIGAGAVGMRVARRLREAPSYGLRPVGFLDAMPLQAEASIDDGTVPILGGPADLELVVRAVGVKHVVLAFSNTPDADLVVLVQRCEALGLEVTVVPRLFESVNGRFRYETVGGLPLLSLRQTRPRGLGFAVKHSIDRTFALAALMVLGPVLAAIAVAVRLSSPGPVLFAQERVGRDGKAFDLYKFRSMAPLPADAEGFAPAAGSAPGGIEGADRRTRIGRILRRSSLDELPQLLNVLRGDMSLVGPRPERPQYVGLFGEHIARYDDRHRVKSGMTGWAQVHGLRGQTSLADRVEWDNFYIEHWSLALDLRILVLTCIAVFRAAE